MIQTKRTKPRRTGKPTPRIKVSANFRSQALRDIAKDCPRCMSCGKPNDGTIVGCHSNSQRHGKGMGQKAHDLVAYCCSECHDLMDGRRGTLTRFERENLFLDAVFWSLLWAFQDGKVKVA